VFSCGAPGADSAIAALVHESVEAGFPNTQRGLVPSSPARYHSVKPGNFRPSWLTTARGPVPRWRLTHADAVNPAAFRIAFGAVTSSSTPSSLTAEPTAPPAWIVAPLFSVPCRSPRNAVSCALPSNDHCASGPLPART